MSNLVTQKSTKLLAAGQTQHETVGTSRKVSIPLTGSQSDAKGDSSALPPGILAWRTDASWHSKNARAKARGRVKVARRGKKGKGKGRRRTGGPKFDATLGYPGEGPGGPAEARALGYFPCPLDTKYCARKFWGTHYHKKKKPKSASTGILAGALRRLAQKNGHQSPPPEMVKCENVDECDLPRHEHLESDADDIAEAYSFARKNNVGLRKPTVPPQGEERFMKECVQFCCKAEGSPLPNEQKVNEAPSKPHAGCVNPVDDSPGIVGDEPCHTQGVPPTPPPSPAKVFKLSASAREFVPESSSGCCSGVSSGLADGGGGDSSSCDTPVVITGETNELEEQEEEEEEAAQDSVYQEEQELIKKAQAKSGGRTPTPTPPAQPLVPVPPRPKPPPPKGPPPLSLATKLVVLRFMEGDEHRIIWRRIWDAITKPVTAPVTRTRVAPDEEHLVVETTGLVRTKWRFFGGWRRATRTDKVTGFSRHDQQHISVLTDMYKSEATVRIYSGLFNLLNTDEQLAKYKVTCAQEDASKWMLTAGFPTAAKRVASHTRYFKHPKVEDFVYLYTILYFVQHRISQDMLEGAVLGRGFQKIPVFQPISSRH